MGGSSLQIAGEGKETQLVLRSLDSFENIPIQGTEGAFDPFFSYDGQWIGFFADNEFKKVSITGDNPFPLCEVTLPTGACWGANQTIVFSQNEGYDLFVISEQGGTARSVGKRKPGVGYCWPEFLPGKNEILVWGGGFSDFIRIVSLDTGEEKRLCQGRSPKYLETGHLLYIQDGGIQAVPFDINSHTLGPSPVTVIDNVRIESTQAAQYAFSKNGTLVYATGRPLDLGRLVWRYRTGEIEELPFPAEVYGDFKISPGGRKIAVPIFKVGKWNIWIYDLDNGQTIKLTDQGDDFSPVWTKDGQSILFSSLRDGTRNVFVKSVGGMDEAIQLTDTEELSHPSSLAGDGNLLAVMEVGADKWDIYLITLDGSREISPFADSSYNEWGAEFSPKDRFIAYTSSEQAPYSVWVQPYPPTGTKTPISTAEGGEEPAWSKNSKELFYRIGQKWMVVKYSDDLGFTMFPPEVLFEGNYINIGGRSYDVSPDGSRFLLLKPVEESTSTDQLNIVFNWFEELERKLKE